MFLFESVYGRHRVNNPDDEFYTRYVDCVKEYQYYDFSNKVVYCNCDNPVFSQVYKYFHDNFKKLQLKKLYSTYYAPNSLVTIYDGHKEEQYLAGEDGSFDSPTSLSILQKADIVVSNPPFGKLVIKYIQLMVENNKPFISIVPYTVITNPIIRSYFQQGLLLSGHNYVHLFTRPDGTIKGAPTFWCTNINNHDHAPLKKMNPKIIKSDEGYDIVKSYVNIPEKFDGELIVPMSYIAYYDPDEFEIIRDIQYRYNGIIKHGIVIKMK